MTVHTEYDGGGFEQPDPDPIVQFEAWYADAREAGLYEPEAMVVATTAPAARVVLMRGVDARGFRFYTNYDSAKAREIAADPRVSLTFAWLPSHRSVRVTGTAAKLDAAESDAYFASRPRGSRIGAWASPQSEVIPDRAALDARVREIEQRFEGTEEIPRPPGWGGFLVTPETLEFWQGRPSRLHDRLRYRRDDGGAWVVERLAP